MAKDTMKNVVEINPMEFKVVSFREEPLVIPPVDSWFPEEGDEIFKHEKGSIILPISEYYGLEDAGELDIASLSSKRCYNSEEIREHITKYLNYFSKFYDQDRELQSIYSTIKYLIDIKGEHYTQKMFIEDLKRYFMRGVMFYKVKIMTDDNYQLNLTYKNLKNPGLQYNNKHAKILLISSVIMNMMIPLITHYIFKSNIINVNGFILACYDELFSLYDVDIYNKLYETAYSSIQRNEKHNSVLWKKQDIRGKNITTHATSSVVNIILNIMPKYKFDGDIIRLNFTSIINNTCFQITDIGYEYNFVPLSSNKRDQENNSEFDKYESFLTKQDEGLYLQNKVACEDTMKNIERLYGPFSNEEIRYYERELTKNKDTNNPIMDFQSSLIFNLFSKYFGDPQTIKSINRNDYIKLMLGAKKRLIEKGMNILPYILTARVGRLIRRKSINKKELAEIESTPLYIELDKKYPSQKVKDHIFNLLSTILSSDFFVVDYHHQDITGTKIESAPRIIFEELYSFVELI